MKKILTLIATVAVCALAHAGEFPDISLEEVKTLAESKKAVILDVNAKSSYDKGHVPGALHYPTIKDKLADYLPKDKGALIVAYCGSPKCPAYAAAAKAAKELGYTNVKHMSAGISGWRKAGLKTE